MQMIVDHTLALATILAVDEPQVVTNFEHIYIYRNWDGWVWNLAFERRLLNLREQAGSVFAGWHNVEIIAVPILRRLFLFLLVLAWCMEAVECTGIYPIPIPWLCIYLSPWTTDAEEVHQRTYNEVAQRQFVLLYYGVDRYGVVGDLFDGFLRCAVGGRWGSIKYFSR